MKDNFFTNFGFKTINAKDKIHMVKGVFDSVASKYDVMNDFMSLGVHRIWKKEFVDMLQPEITKELIDVGGGTADISLQYLKKGGEKATVVDINEKMLEEGRKKALNNGYVSSIKFVNANAEELPFADNLFPVYSISFCIRNVTDISKALSEAYRVLKPNGKFFCLEFSSVENEVFSKLYDEWSFRVIPKIGKIVTKDEDSYKYLVESIRKFPKQEEFANMIKSAGFKQVGYKSLTQGVAAIHWGSKIIDNN